MNPKIKPNDDSKKNVRSRKKNIKMPEKKISTFLKKTLKNICQNGTEVPVYKDKFPKNF